jgi:hypothetical protein
VALLALECAYRGVWEVEEDKKVASKSRLIRDFDRGISLHSQLKFWEEKQAAGESE